MRDDDDGERRELAGHAFEAYERRRGGAAGGERGVVCGEAGGGGGGGGRGGGPRVEAGDGDAVGGRGLARRADGKGLVDAARGGVLDGDGGVAGGQRGQESSALGAAEGGQVDLEAERCVLTQRRDAEVELVGGQGVDHGRSAGGVQARLGRQRGRVEPGHRERHGVGERAGGQGGRHPRCGAEERDGGAAIGRDGGDRVLRFERLVA